MDKSQKIHLNRFHRTPTLQENEKIKLLDQDSGYDLLEPQFYPDPVLFRASLDKLKKDDQELKKNLKSNKATLRVLAPYLKIIQKDQRKIIDQARNVKSPKTNDAKQSSNKKFKEQFIGVVPNISERCGMISSLQETADILKALVKARKVMTYLVDSARNELHLSPESTSSTSKLSSKIEPGTTIAAYTAFTKKYVISNNITLDSRFPLGLGSSDSVVKYCLCVPINTSDNKVVAVYELLRYAFDIEFNKRDTQLVLAVTSWIGAAALQNSLYSAFVRQHKLTNYLLQLTCHYHSIDATVEKTLSDFVIFARETIRAEQCSLYIVEKRFKNSITLEEYNQGVDNKNVLFKGRSKKYIQNDESPLSRTIFHKETVNKYGIVRGISLDEEKENRSLLCVPILSTERVIGAIWLDNKMNASQFDKEDAEILQRFAAFCSININHMKTQGRMKRSEVKKTINDEMLCYHIEPCSHDQVAISKKRKEDFPEQFFTFMWYPTAENLPKLVELTVRMFHEVLGGSFMVLNNVPKFVLTVRNCYRPNPYHNFVHAFSVAHTMANIITRYHRIFTGLERKGLMVAALCHDLDHRGYTNNFIQLTKHYLANLYESSPLENHHFAVTKMILSQCGMFRYFKPEIYNELLAEIYECVIATDLSLYFQCRMELMRVADEKAFTFKNPNHRRLVKSLIMTACDLSGQTKPLPISAKITEDVYEEFFQQGDIEKQMGFSPLPTMDRDKGGMLAENQVQFLSVVVIPCVETVSRIFSTLSPMVWDSRALLKQWKELVDIKDHLASKSKKYEE